MSTTVDAEHEPGTEFPPRRRRSRSTEVITFIAACPCCGRDCEWREQRVETRLQASVRCDCP